jgi:RHS repeat-associated protein
MNRLSSGEDKTNTYDELSNLVTKGTDKYIYQDPDEDDSDQMRLELFNDGTNHEYTYDENGNPTEITNKFSSLEYDNLNMLRRIVHSQTDDYWYNSAGLRVKKVEDAIGTPITTYTLYDGDNILMQEVYEGSTRIQVTFNIIVGGKILGEYKRVYPSTDSVVYFYLDNLNSRRVVLDSSGTAIDRYRYSAWGVATQDAGSDDYRSFTGKEYDASGLIYFNARYYDPGVGRFVTEDPSEKGTGWYSYTSNNPINMIDVMGLQSTGPDYSKPNQAPYAVTPSPQSTPSPAQSNVLPAPIPTPSAATAASLGPSQPTPSAASSTQAKSYQTPIKGISMSDRSIVFPHTYAACDIMEPEGTPIYAVADGKVIYITLAGNPDAGNSGNFVRIGHEGGYESYYSHMQFTPLV